MFILDDVDDAFNSDLDDEFSDEDVLFCWSRDERVVGALLTRELLLADDDVWGTPPIRLPVVNDIHTVNSGLFESKLWSLGFFYRLH